MCNYWKLKIREMGQAAGGEKSPRKSSCQTTPKGSVARKKMRKQAHQRQEFWQSLGRSTRRTRCGRMAPVVSMPRASPPHSRSSRRGRTVPIPDGLTAKILQSLLLEQRTMLCLNFKGGMFKFYILLVFNDFERLGMRVARNGGARTKGRQHSDMWRGFAAWPSAAEPFVWQPCICLARTHRSACRQHCRPILLATFSRVQFPVIHRSRVCCVPPVSCKVWLGMSSTLGQM